MYQAEALYYCPFCSTQLPKILNNELFAILETSFNMRDPWNNIINGTIPEEFKTDKWWKKRGL